MNNINNNFLIGKSSDGTAKSITGEITELSYSCRTFQYDHIENYKILPSLREGRIKASYRFDEDVNEFLNLFGYQKQTTSNKGLSQNPDGHEPPLITASPSQYFELSNDKMFNTKPNDFEDQPSTFRVYTAILRVKVHQLPQKGSHHFLFTINNPKSISVKISGTGNLMLVGSSVRSDPSVKINVGDWNFIKITFTLFLDQSLPHDCSLGVEVLGVGEFGADFECKLFPFANFFFRQEN